MTYKRMLSDTGGVPVGCTVCAGLWPAFQLPKGTGCSEGPFASPLTHFWEQQTGAFCSQAVADCLSFVRVRKPYERFLLAL